MTIAARRVYVVNCDHPACAAQHVYDAPDASRTRYAAEAAALAVGWTRRPSRQHWCPAHTGGTVVGVRPARPRPQLPPVATAIVADRTR